jgi:hypothetical protein
VPLEDEAEREGIPMVDLDDYGEKVLACVFANAKGRKILFSSFHPVPLSPPFFSLRHSLFMNVGCLFRLCQKTKPLSCLLANISGLRKPFGHSLQFTSGRRPIRQVQ